MKWIIALCVAGLISSGQAIAQGKSGDKGKSSKGPKQSEENADLSDSISDILLGPDAEQTGKKAKSEASDDGTGIGGILVDIVFGDDDRETIRDYYSDRRVNVDRLPPGIAKNLQRGKPLPPGIAKKNLPDDLESRLAPVDGLRRQILGNDIALIDPESNVIVDIIKGVVNG